LVKYAKQSTRIAFWKNLQRFVIASQKTLAFATSFGDGENMCYSWQIWLQKPSQYLYDDFRDESANHLLYQLSLHGAQITVGPSFSPKKSMSHGTKRP